MTITEYQVDGMTCASCEKSVQEEVGSIGGVQDVQAEAQSGRMIITSDDPVSVSEVAAAVEGAGYKLVGAGAPSDGASSGGCCGGSCGCS
ncbi:heavy-metal-associated domain-containing protein [Gordonia sp. (in: high G+C Gram-positive bacteria)]|uniref:heavy-metal-associated domain-containing protein n=1 Tax=Gordonia sp. (in: high G+C Gram-positive bacteria) TaxID=84139 RepID=UPI0039E231A5